ncbi:FAD-binding domain-containing protein [Mycena venus]|uniref:FAD-binding domain-containing protein n=1 Tax=Mycena venus TaxID=2733690 RepID=A0A8H6XHA4_9AGAR|nr:FAD-binding domain-containing protein [Mycena venus]
MWPHTASLVLLFALFGNVASASSACRNIPGSPGYPSLMQWNAFNSTISGRLVPVVPSAKYCESLPRSACTDEQWTSALFRGTIPGAMDQVNWEQGYDLKPPSLCLRNGTSTCGQGDVPIYSVEAETVEDIKYVVKFASNHNLRLVVKASGHDLLGRSTAPNSLLVRTSKFQNLSFTDAFFVGDENMGSAVTVGSGVYANTLYEQAKTHGKIVVAGAAATIVTAGGYIQGGGHSALSPLLGLAADNALEFQIVVANGELLQVNGISHPDLFYALRGGGAGSWGVIVSATIKTFPTFNATQITTLLTATNNSVAGELATLHARHIFDWDSVHASQYVSFAKDPTVAGSAIVFGMATFVPDTTTSQSEALMEPFLNASLALPGVSLLEQQSFQNTVINDILFQTDDSVATNAVLGSRLIPASTYSESPEKVGEVYKKLLDCGTAFVVGVFVAGGKVAENANISSAIHPAWRTAKSHVFVSKGWNDSASVAEIRSIRNQFQTTQLPILKVLAGPNAGAYSNEADVLEPDFQHTFFGPNYAKLSAIKWRYDPHDLFIVGSGVGSERWDEWGICRV